MYECRYFSEGYCNIFLRSILYVSTVHTVYIGFQDCYWINEMFECLRLLICRLYWNRHNNNKNSCHIPFFYRMLKILQIFDH